jgi:hypothetical protein
MDLNFQVLASIVWMETTGISFLVRILPPSSSCIIAERKSCIAVGQKCLYFVKEQLACKWTAFLDASTIIRQFQPSHVIEHDFLFAECLQCQH